MPAPVKSPTGVVLRKHPEQKFKKKELAAPRFTLLRNDSSQILPFIPANSIDLLLLDPPYNLNGYSTGNIELKWRTDINNDVAKWDKKQFNPSEWVDEFRRILKPIGNIFAFTSYNLLGKWHEAFDPVFHTFQFMVWHKTNPVPKIYKTGFLNSCELIVCMWDKGHSWNFSRQKEMHNFIEAPICMGHERLKKPFHPTQKPLRVLKRLIAIASNPGDHVFDPFMGVGSTGVAALQMGRKFLGVEIDPTYFSAAVKRLRQAAQATQQTTLNFKKPPD